MLDDQKIFRQIDQVHAHFTIRACHNRTVEVYNDRLDRWEEELLHDLTASVPLSLRVRVTFTHARKVRQATSNWVGSSSPARNYQLLWGGGSSPDDHDLVLLTNILSAAQAQAVCRMALPT
jgi:hypothetical protein